MKVRFSESAAAVYDDALTRIRAVNQFAAVRFADKVGQALRRIGRYPQSGHFVPEYPNVPVRQFIVEPYRFFYFVDEQSKLIRFQYTLTDGKIEVPHGRVPRPAVAALLAHVELMNSLSPTAASSCLEQMAFKR